MSLVEIVKMGKAEADADTFARRRNLPRKSNSAGATSNTHKRLKSILDPLSFTQAVNAVSKEQSRPSSKAPCTKNVRHVFRDEQSKRSRQNAVKDPAFITQN